MTSSKTKTLTISCDDLFSDVCLRDYAGDASDARVLSDIQFILTFFKDFQYASRIQIESIKLTGSQDAH